MIGRLLLFLALLTGLGLAGCGGGGGSSSAGGNNSSGSNATYSGSLQTTQAGATASEPIDLVLTSSNPVGGSIFHKSDGAVLSIAGSANNLQVTAPAPYPENYTGSLVFNGSNASISLQGSNPAGAVTANGSLTQGNYLNIAGS